MSIKNTTYSELGTEDTIPSVSDIPEATDEGFVFDRLASSLATNVVTTSAQKTGLAKEISNLTIDKDKDSRLPTTRDEATLKQRRIRNLLEKGSIISSRVDSFTSKMLEKLKDYDMQVDISNNPMAKKAVKKIFKKNVKYISKAMYLEAVERFNAIQNKRVKDEVDI